MRYKISRSLKVAVPVLIGVAMALAAIAQAAPTVSYTYAPANPTVNQQVSFDGSGTTCDRSPCTYSWSDDGPDGAGGTNWPLGSGVTLDYTFSGVGTKWVRLTVRNARGRTSSTVKAISVSDNSEPTPTPTETPTETPTATPTATPTPPPTQGSNCFSSPGSCGYPDPASGNVGVPAGTTLRPSGDITVTTPGAVIDGLDIKGTIRVLADNVTIKNTKVTATNCGEYCQWLIISDCDCNTTISHVEFTGTQPNSVGHAVRNDTNGQVNIDHVYQHGTVDSLCYCGSGNSGGSAVIEDSYSIISLAIPGDHLENIYADNSAVTVRHNTFFNSEPQTANIFGNTNNGTTGPCQNKFVITDNLLAGGGFSIYTCAHATSQGTSTATITGNRFARCGGGTEVMGGGGTWYCPGGPDSHGYFPRSGSFGRLAASMPNTVWANNTWDDNGAPASGS